MGFVFHPTIVRVQHPNFILHELHHYKILLDNSPIMDALFSPATVPIPPSAPWPSNFQAQKYLPPPDFYEEKLHEQNEPQQNLRRTNVPEVPHGSLRKNLPADSLRRVQQQSEHDLRRINHPEENLRRVIDPKLAVDNLRRILHPNAPDGNLRRVIQPDHDLRRVLQPNAPKGNLRRVLDPKLPVDNLRRIIQPNSPEGDMRRTNLPEGNMRRIMPEDALEDSIRRSMESMNALFKPQFNMPDLSKAISDAVKVKIEVSKVALILCIIQIVS